MKDWEKEVLTEPGAIERVAEMEDELRWAAGLTENLAQRTTADLLAAWAPLHAELARRFGNSNIVGCYGELLVATAVGGTLRANSAAGGDVELPDGRLIEVKCRRAGDGPGRHSSGIFKWDRAINGWPFHFAAFVQLDEATLRPVRAFMLDAARLGEPKPFGKKSPVLGRQLYGNRRYDGEIDLLTQMTTGRPVVLPTANPRVPSPPREVRAPQPPAPRALAEQGGSDAMSRSGDLDGPAGDGVDWVWLGSGAIEEFKRWRLRQGATPGSASSYASGARAFVRYARSVDLYPTRATESFLDYLARTTDLTPRARSDYRSHARAFAQFLRERGRSTR